MSEQTTTIDEHEREVVNYIGEIYELLRMARINLTMIEKAFAHSRAAAHEGTVYTYHFCEGWTEDILFVAGNIEDRAKKLYESRKAIDPEGFYE